MASNTLPQYVAALSAAFGAFATGTVLGWTNPAQAAVQGGELGFSVNNEEFSWIGSCATLGAALMCIPTGFLITFFGRKITMLLLVIPFTMGWMSLCFPANVIMMYLGRFLLGLGSGAFCVAAPLYNGEIAETNIRGTVGSFFQMEIVLGILFIYAIGGGIEDPKMLSMICAALPIIFFIIFIFMPESPTYLITKGKEEKAVKAMQWLRGKDYDVNAEINELKAAEDKSKEKQDSVWAALGRKATLKAMAITIGLMFVQQISGINAVIFYSTAIFEDAQTGIDAKLSTILIGVIQLIATMVAVLSVDKSGRRILLLISAIFMAVSTLLMGVYFFMKQNDAESVSSLSWLPVSSLCLFIVMFSIGFGPVPWIMLGELFAVDIKGVAGSIAGTTNWLFAFIVAKTFINLSDAIGQGQTFWFYSAFTFLGAIFVFFFVPETKGKSMKEIQELLE